MNIDFLKLISGKKTVVGFVAACVLAGGSVAIASAAGGSLTTHSSSEASESSAASEASDVASVESEEGGKWQHGMPASAGAPAPGGGNSFGQWVAAQHRRNGGAPGVPNRPAKADHKPAAAPSAGATETAG